jgi:hypothetical protein
MKELLLGAPASSPASIWRSRGYIPHFDQPGVIQSITFRLYDAVPEALVNQWKIELNWISKIPATDPRQIALKRRIEAYEDIGYGVCWLRRADIASIAEQALLHFDGKRYRIIAWCVMPMFMWSSRRWKDIQFQKYFSPGSPILLMKPIGFCIVPEGFGSESITIVTSGMPSIRLMPWNMLRTIP